MTGSLPRLLLTGTAFCILASAQPALADAGAPPAKVVVATVDPVGPSVLAHAGPTARPAVRVSARPVVRSVAPRAARRVVSLPYRGPSVEVREIVRARLASMLILGVGY